MSLNCKPMWCLPIVILFVSLHGCLRIPDVVVPMRTLYETNGPANKTLLVFLPGYTNTELDVKENGFFEIVQDRSLPVDLMAVNAHFGYLAEGIVIERLLIDVIQPAKQRGYKSIWLIGVSLGGYIALKYKYT